MGGDINFTRLPYWNFLKNRINKKGGEVQDFNHRMDI